MCGICGTAIPKKLNRLVKEESLRVMRDALTHRGPDEAANWINPAKYVGLGHRRLSIVDLSSGQQPMPNEDQQVWIAFNGEIYNHAQLRPSLEAAGHRYRTHSDTETIIHAYEQHGVSSAKQLRGMFAYAIWDETKEQLTLARDRIGIKPLYYALLPDGTLHFASEIKALIESKAVAPELNYRMLADQFANRYTSGDETLFKGIKRLLPGHTLTWREGKIEINQYWQLDYTKSGEAVPEREYVERFREMFRDAVSSHLMADVPLGMFLSGGIDSSAIVGVMSQLVNDQIKTFSVAFNEREANELEYAAQVARAFKTDHHEIVVSPEEFFHSLPSLIYQEDEPIAHPSSVPLYFVSKLAREYVKVVLTGEGADELLAGYNKYRVTMYNLQFGWGYEKLTPGFVRGLVKGGIGILPGENRVKQKLQRTFLCLPPHLRNIYFDNFAVFSPDAQSKLFSSATLAQMGETDPYRQALDYVNNTQADSLLDQLLSADMHTYLQELLMKQDQMSMAASIESRVPFLDNEMIEFATRLPVDMKLRGTTTKHVLREAMKGVLPDEILTRKKMGFPVPIGAWFRGAFKHIIDHYVLSERTLNRGHFDAAYVRNLVARHQAGENHAERLWALVNFEIWQRRFFDGETGCDIAQTVRLEKAVAVAR